MSAIIQIATISGRMIDAARWEVSSISNLREGHQLKLNIATDDTKLLSYLGKGGSPDCSIDNDNGKYSVIVNCTVKSIQHMLDGTSSSLTSMAILIPMNRTVEGVIIYLTDITKCDPRFIKLIQSSGQLS